MLVRAAIGVAGVGVPWFSRTLVQGERGVSKGTDDELAERLPQHLVAHPLCHVHGRLSSPLVPPAVIGVQSPLTPRPSAAIAALRGDVAGGACRRGPAAVARVVVIIARIIVAVLEGVVVRRRGSGPSSSSISGNHLGSAPAFVSVVSG